MQKFEEMVEEEMEERWKDYWYQDDVTGVVLVPKGVENSREETSRPLGKWRCTNISQEQR